MLKGLRRCRPLESVASLELHTASFMGKIRISPTADSTFLFIERMNVAIGVLAPVRINNASSSRATFNVNTKSQSNVSSNDSLALLHTK
jgi:hypothetical protein